MSFLTSPFKSYVRWRHSLGFGVHSPFAYTLVQMAVNPGIYGYYGYSDIDRVILAPGFKGDSHSRADARLLLRLLVNLRSRRLLLPEGLPAMCAAARAAGVGCVKFKGNNLPKPHPGDLLVSIADVPGPSELEARIKAGSAILAISPTKQCVETMYEACKRGLIFHGNRIVITVPREDMAFVAYPMRF